ncbi:hypothetical protein ZEAMMB73_Zm00001d033135 [Zea mays]|uniref:Uncharacterized protein n=1 Tax=Zea mays TaxID=4577 RepID=A0A1D6KWI7_MAIZE|nr:hypothetical protein ZEAMMB73_Zm00001d033135 [Zea mays]
MLLDPLRAPPAPALYMEGKPTLKSLLADGIADGNHCSQTGLQPRSTLSPALALVERQAVQEESHLATSSEILASTDKLAECQETITILSKQLQALKMPTASGPPDTPPFAFPGRARRSPTTSHSRSRASSPRPPRLPVPLPPRPRTPQVLSKKDEGEVRATATPTTRSATR